MTAAKREENLQDVAISIKAFSNEDLDEMGADTFTDYARSVPSLSFAERGSNRNQIILRGLGPSVGLPTVGAYLDGVPVQISFETVDPRLFDIERIEILRGPQGTLYGEGSLGGTINVISARPKLDRLEAKVAAEYLDIAHGGDGENFSGMVNLPAGRRQVRGAHRRPESQSRRLHRFSAGRRRRTPIPMMPSTAGCSRRGARTRSCRSPASITTRMRRSSSIRRSAPRFQRPPDLDKYSSNQAFRTLWDWKTKQGTLADRLRPRLRRPGRTLRPQQARSRPGRQPGSVRLSSTSSTK